MWVAKINTMLMFRQKSQSVGPVEQLIKLKLPRRTEILCKKRPVLQKTLAAGILHVNGIRNISIVTKFSIYF